MPIITQAYVAHDAETPMRIEDVIIDEIKAGEVLVETVALSICASDIKAAAGKFHMKPPLIPGHEASGIVKEVGSGITDIRPGDPVVLSISSCSTCPSCKASAPAYCRDLTSYNFSGYRRDGSHAITTADGKPLKSFFFGQSSMSRLVLAQASSIVRLAPETTLDELRKFPGLGCGIQTGAGAILNVCAPPPSSRIAILGAGSVGLSAALAALTTSPAQLILMDNDARKFARLPFSIRSSPVVTTIDSSLLTEPGSVTSALLDATAGDGADFVLDCVGLPRLIEDAVPALAKRGTVVTVGGGAPGAEVGIRMVDMLIGGRTWRGTHQGDSDPGEFIPKMIAMWRRGEFAFDELLTFYKFDEFDKALADLKGGQVYKPVLVVR